MESQSKINTKTFFFVILGLVVLWLFVFPKVIKLSEHLENVLKPSDGLVKIDQNRCSRQCCKHAQWPVPFNLTDHLIPDEEMQKYVGSNMSCNFGEGSGCLCISKDDFKYLSNRGNNSPSGTCNN